MDILDKKNIHKYDVVYNNGSSRVDNTGFIPHYMVTKGINRTVIGIIFESDVIGGNMNKESSERALEWYIEYQNK